MHQELARELRAEMRSVKKELMNLQHNASQSQEVCSLTRF